uniref:Uncharacterized protein n=1 Tax=Clastoptera arizonana TaxID=38151 RepID=A0A1B6CDR4_9HEMI
MKASLDILSLKEELDQEIKYRDQMLASNRELEDSIKNMERELGRLQKEDPNNLTPPSPGSVGYEGYQRLQEQLKINAKFVKEAIMEQEKLRILADAETDITDLNLDNLSQSELIRIVKQLERLRTDLQSTLRETEQQLDVQAKEFLKLNDTKKLYQTEFELRERNKSLKRF